MRHLRTPNVTFDFYILPNLPPAGPDIEEAPGYLHPWFFPGMQLNRGATPYFFDSALDVELTVEVDDPFPNFPGAYRVYIPDKMNQGYDVVAIERFRFPPYYGGHGGQDFKRIFLKRRVWSVKPGLITEGGLRLAGSATAGANIGASGGLHLAGATSISRPASTSGGLMLAGNSTRVGGNSQTFFSNTTFTVPSYFTPGGQITLIAIGGGASGDGGGPTAAGGGGAGAYAKTVINVGPGQPITITVGAAGLGANGGDSWASITGGAPANPGQGALAKGGAPGSATTGGTGGGTAASIGTTKQAGGNGGSVPGGGSYGGGGGGGAGLANHNNGTNGAINTPGTGGAGDFGSGGNGGNPLGNPNGQNATGTGSGCGGGGGTTGNPRGLGAGGRVIVQW